MNIVITAGGTSEPIDKVRKIANMSKGTLGQKLAFYAEAHQKINKVYFLADKSVIPDGSKVIPVVTSSVQDLYDNLKKILSEEKIDIVIHAMAVSDYTVDFVFDLEAIASYLFDKTNHSHSVDMLKEWIKEGVYRLDNSSKISSKSDDLFIKLKPTPKIISKIKEWSPSSVLVGFKLLENVSRDELLRVALALKEKNNCDYVFANDIKLIRESGHQGFLVLPDGKTADAVGLDEICYTILEQTAGSFDAPDIRG